MNNERPDTPSAATAGEFIDCWAQLTYVKRHLFPVAEMHGALLQAADSTC